MTVKSERRRDGIRQGQLKGRNIRKNRKDRWHGRRSMRTYLADD